MRQQQSQEDARQVKHRESLGFLLWISGVFAVASEVFLHHSHGRDWPGMRGVFGLLAILFSVVLFPNQDVTSIILFLLAYMAACAVGRINVVFRSDHYMVHSQYSGRPRLMWLLRFISEDKIKRVVEPLLVLVVGIAFLDWQQPVGLYLVFSGFGLFISTNVPELYMRRRVQELYDSVCEQQAVAERLRQLMNKRK